MRRRTIVLLLAGVVGVTAAAHGNVVPKKARVLKAELVQAFPECSAGGATLDAFGLPACPQQPVAGGCYFDAASGKGQVQAKVVEGGIRFKVKVKGMLGCQAAPLLTLVASVVINTDACGGQPCTTVALDEPIGTCTPTDGKCTIDAEFPVPAGQATSIAIRRVSLHSGATPIATFEAGLLVP